MDLYIIYSDFLYEGIYFIVNHKVYQEKLSSNEEYEDYDLWRTPEPDISAQLMEIYNQKGNEDFEVIESVFPEFYIAAIKPY